MEKINLIKAKVVAITLMMLLLPLISAEPTSIPVKPVKIAPEIQTTELAGINKTQLGNDIMDLARKIALPHHLDYLNISERISALKDILHNKNVYTEADLRRFISQNNIDVNLFNKKVENSVNALSTAQYHLLLAYNLFQQDKLQESQGHLILAQRQYKIFQDYVADLSYMIDHWKPLQKHKFVSEDFLPIRNETIQDTVYPDIHKIETTQKLSPEPAKKLQILKPQKQQSHETSWFEELWQWLLSIFS